MGDDGRGAVHRYLVTGPPWRRAPMWMVTSSYANWIEGRGDTWAVTVFGEEPEHFLAAAREAAVTVEEIEGAGEDERYVLLVGEPGTGWRKAGEGDG